MDGCKLATLLFRWLVTKCRLLICSRGTRAPTSSTLKKGAGHFPDTVFEWALLYRQEANRGVRMTFGDLIL